MDFFSVLILSFVQGVTEFLPISSSAHLILFPAILGWQEQGLAFDLAVHFGTLIAVCGYFRKEILLMIRSFLTSPKPNKVNKDAYLVWKIVIATVPIVIAGFVLKDFIDLIRTPQLIAFGMIVFALFLWHSDRYQHRIAQKDKSLLRNEYDMSLLHAFIIGVSQVIAIIPGTSRSGITMTTAMYLKLDRVSAARFSFLLSIPTILLGFIWQMLKVAQNGLDMPLYYLLLAVALSAIFAWITIYYFLKIIATIKLDIFVAYRLILGVLIIMIFF